MAQASVGHRSTPWITTTVYGTPVPEDGIGTLSSRLLARRKSRTERNARLPTYEYHCDSCDQNFDVVQSFQDDPITSCPTCGSPVRKVFGNVGIVFKGTGFYKNDSREKKTPAKSTAGDSSTTSDTGSDTSGSGSSDTSGSGSESNGSAASTDASPSKPDAPSKTHAATAPAPSGPGKDSGSGSSSP
jgi:putative FmdB family regulatory protein